MYNKSIDKTKVTLLHYIGNILCARDSHHKNKMYGAYNYNISSNNNVNSRKEQYLCINAVDESKKNV